MNKTLWVVVTFVAVAIGIVGAVAATDPPKDEVAIADRYKSIEEEMKWDPDDMAHWDRWDWDHPCCPEDGRVKACLEEQKASVQAIHVEAQEGR